MLRDMGHSLIFCSPYPDSTDYWVYDGFIQGSSKDNSKIGSVAKNLRISM
jgi:hypothetical protein